MSGHRDPMEVVLEDLLEAWRALRSLQNQTIDNVKLIDSIRQCVDLVNQRVDRLHEALKRHEHRLSLLERTTITIDGQVVDNDPEVH